MKRIMVCLMACMLFAACGTPAESTAHTETEAGTAKNGASRPGEQNNADPAGTESSDPSVEVETVTAATLPNTAIEPNSVPASERFPGKFSDTPVYGDRSYKSKTIDITITTYTVKDTYSKLTTYHVADIYVKDVTLIKTAPARSFDTRYERTVKDIAGDAGALLAIDGDTYTHVKKSFIIRNGVLYRDTPIENTDICILYRDGRMETRKWGEYTLEEVVASDPWQVWGFGPALLDENGHAMEIRHELSGHNPRAAIGYYEPGHYCFVIVDGRDHDWSEGVKLTALSRLMEDLGCKVAYNLDGGDSAVMYWNGEIISKSRNETRVVSDIIYILPEE